MFFWCYKLSFWCSKCFFGVINCLFGVLDCLLMFLNGCSKWVEYMEANQEFLWKDIFGVFLGVSRAFSKGR